MSSRVLTVATGATLLTPLVCLPAGLPWIFGETARRLHGVVRPPSIHDSVNVPKLVAASVCNGILVALVAWAVARDSGRPRLVRAFVALLAIAAGAIVAWSLTQPPVDAVRALKPLLPYAVMVGLFWAAALVEPARRAVEVAIPLLCAAVAAAILAEVWGVPMPTTSAPWIDPPAALFTHRNVGALILVAGVPLSLARLADDARARAAAVAFVLEIGALGAAQSRTAVLAALVAVLTLAAIDRVRRAALAGRWRRVALLALAGVLLCAAAPHRAPLSLVDKTARLFAAVRHGHLADASTLERRAAGEERTSARGDAGLTDRLELWRISLGMIERQPAGSGLGSFKEELRPLLPGDAFVQPHAHNAWLQVTVEGGLLLLAVALATVAIVAVAAARLLRRAGSDAIRARATPFVAAAAGLGVAALFETLLVDVGPNLVSAAVAGTLLGYADRVRAT